LAGQATRERIAAVWSFASLALFNATHQLDARPTQSSGDSAGEAETRIVSGLNLRYAALRTAGRESDIFLAQIELVATLEDHFAERTLGVRAPRHLVEPSAIGVPNTIHLFMAGIACRVTDA